LSEAKPYVIRGGVEGRERLRLLSRIMRPTSGSLLDRLDLRDGLACLDVGCGGGDMTVEIAQRVSPHGRVVGVDLDDVALALARGESAERGVANVEFHRGDVHDAAPVAAFDVVYARFLLTHLRDPAAAVRSFFASLRPGGTVAVEDIDFTGHFTYPDSAASRRYQELYCAIVRRRGADPDIGPRLPSLLKSAGFERIETTAVQPIGMEGEVKLMNPVTMENIADAVLQEGLATRAEIDDLVEELYAIAADRETVAGVPRIVQAWGRRPSG
jgi:SAM-dependent methyltransferase